MRKPLLVAVQRVVLEVCFVQGEEEGSQGPSLRGLCTANNHVRQAVLCSHKLWMVGEVVKYPRGEMLIHPPQVLKTDR